MTINSNIKNLIFSILVLMFFVYSVEAFSPRSNITNISNDIKMLSYRANNLTLIKEDYETIDKFANMFLNIENKIELKDLSYWQIVIGSFNDAISQNQLPNKQLMVIKRFAIAIKSYTIFKKSNRDIIDLIWWAQARLIENENDLKKFLNNQVHSIWRKESVLSILVEKGFETEILNLSKQITFKNSELKFKLAVRKANILNAFTSNDPNLYEILINEFKETINLLLPILSKGSNVLHFHYLWFMKQLGVHRKNPEVYRILENLLDNDLYYHMDKLMLIPEGEQELFKIRTKDMLNINYTALKAKYPHKFLDFTEI